MDDNGKLSNFTTEHASAVVILTALTFLILVRRGFRGIK